MKKMIALAMLVSGMVSFAQEKPNALKDDRQKMEQFTPAQQNELRVKELTLKLDLNASQQKEMAKVVADLQARKEAAKTELKKMKDSGKRPTADERFAMRSKMLDEQIAMKERVRKILTDEQMEKWEKMTDSKKRHIKKAVGEHRGKKQRRD
ncbi:hypothetical protein HYN48_00750 [Flavobacterium magnum]|uniref:Periplasmic heavy metal sensor n=1 Tax=Flavobacterium magnum TaxID=2162713 RepID=A0A2S0RAN2_9FLAO|nr:hypothetical protein [Flavobacterium magnum]AWA28733.1 hypothetical protein HYN48_00750 [Flavobacterium magnum]